jgi:DNA helicase-2/ATP-dependent DNA helicase PcrA
MLVALRAAIERGMLSKKALSGAKKFLEVYDRLVHLSSDSIVAMLEYLLKATDYVEYLSGKKGDQEDDSVQSNVQELLADAEEKDSLMSDGEGLQQFLEQISLASDTDQLKSDNRVTLMTLHAAKGLEFDNVYIIAVEQDVLPHMRSKQDPAQMEEERRLFFVGITRAKQTLQISTASSRGFGGGKLTCPSPFLLELPRAEMTIVDKTMRQKSSRSWGSEDLWGSDWKSEDEWSQDVGGDDFEGMDQGMDRVEESDPDESQPLRRPVGSDKEEPTEWVTWDDSDADANRPFVEPSYVLPNPPVRKNKGGGVKGGGEKSLDPPKENPVSSTSTHAKTGKKLPPSLAGLKSGAELTAATTLTGIPVDFFESGTRITHPRYGLGFILSVDGFGPKRMAKIEFDNGDTKSFQLSKSPIDLP